MAAARKPRRSRSAPRRLSPVQLLLLAALATVVLYLLPYSAQLAWPLVLLSTLVHELGHGLTALLMGGRFEALYLWPDASGVAAYRGRFGPLPRALIAAGGLLGPSLMAATLFHAGRRAEIARRALWVGGAVLIVALLFWVRNVFGAIFVAVCAALLIGLALRARPGVQQFAVVFVAIQLCLTVFSRGDYLFMPQAITAQGVVPSDTGQIEQALWLPYWFWGLLIAIASLGILAQGLGAYARAMR